jgi:hypothetical protein
VEDEGGMETTTITAEHQHAFQLPAPSTSKHEENDEKQTSSDDAQEKG